MTRKREARRGSSRRSRRIRSGAQQNKTDKICRRKEIDGATMSTARCARRDEFDYATMRTIRPREDRRCTISKIPQEEDNQRRLRGVHAINDV